MSGTLSTARVWTSTTISATTRDIRIVSYPGHQSTIQIHVGVPPTDNKLVRQAILAAVDAEAFMSSLGPRELWSLCASVYYCNTPLESQGGADLYNQNNLEKARQLIKEAGAEGATIKVMNPNDYGTITPLGSGPQADARGYWPDCRDARNGLGDPRIQDPWR